MQLFILVLGCGDRLERVADSRVLAPLGRGERRHRVGDRSHHSPQLRTAGWRGDDLRQSTDRARGQDEGDEHGQDGARLSPLHHPVQPK